MKAYFAVIASAFKESWMYRFGIIVSALYAPIYITIMYFLWKAVFNESSSGIINGMDWRQTIVYVSISTIIGGNFYSAIDYKIANNVRTGNITTYLIRPMDFQLYFFLRAVGEILVNFIFMLFPSIIYIFFILRLDIALGKISILFVPSLIFGIIIAYLMDYIVGIFSFYTESIYGIANAKAVLLMFFSGRVVPIAFFPGILKNIAMVLPFQAVINIPVSILTNKSLNIEEGVNMLTIQVFWIIVLLVFSRIFFKVSLRNVTINGG